MPPSVEINCQDVTARISEGYTVEWVAEYFDVAASTLYRSYSEALKKGYALRNGCIQQKQFTKAMAGDTTMLIWLGKQWLKQRDKIETEPGDPPRDVTLGNIFEPSSDRPGTADKPN